MNVGILLLIVILILIIIATIGIFIYVVVKNSNSNPVLSSCKSQINIGDLLPLTNADVCYSQSANGLWQPNGQYYIGEISNGQYDYVVAPYGTTPLNVCVSFCNSFTPPTGSTGSMASPNGCTGTSCGTCVGPDYNSQTAQTNFNNCLNQLSSTTCIPPIPLAINDENILYYPFTPTKCGCLDAGGNNPCEG